MRSFLVFFFLGLGSFFITFSSAATDDASDNFNRANGTNLGFTSGGAYPWRATPTPDGTAPMLENGRLTFVSNRGASSSGLGGMAATVDRIKVEDVRIAFDLDIETAPANAWFGITWRQIGKGFDLSGYSLIIFPSGQWTLFGPSLTPVLAQGTVGNRIGQGAMRVEVESVGSIHRVRFDGSQVAQVQHAGSAYARVSLVSLHTDAEDGNGQFRRTVDNLEIENLRSFGPSFPTFRSSDTATADRLNRFFRYHYGYVLNPGPIRGVQQSNWRGWNTISTLWLDTAAHPSGPHDINAELRHNLLNIPLDDEGYVFTYDPASPAGFFFPTIGWPFPTYANSGTESNVELGRRGKAYLWDQRDNTVGWTISGHSASTPNSPGWRIQGSGPVTVSSPAISGSGTFLSPWNPYRPIETFHSPYLALLGVPAEYEVTVQWRLQGQSGWPSENQVVSPPPAQSGTTNRYIPMYRHPQWYGPSETNRNVIQLRMVISRVGGGPVDVTLRRLQSHYDTRHATNNSHFVLGSARYYNWTGDEDFLVANLERMRAAMDHLHTGLKGASLGLLEVNYVGHDGRPGEFRQDFGRGIGSNYYDLLPFGHRDAYSTAYYLGAVDAMAEIEAYVENRGGLGLPPPAKSASALTGLAAGIRDAVNAYFWNASAGRFVGTVDTTDTPHDYGFTLVNLEGLYYGFGTPSQREQVYDWLDGIRTVSGDTSQGSDIYSWRFAPRASTLKNNTYYNWIWPTSNRTRPFGDQVQDGGTALYLSYFDIMNRLEIRGPDDAYARLADIAAWFEEVETEGGYLAYYQTRPGTVQGDIENGQGEGGLGLHLEFVESTMVPTTFLYGILGIDAGPGKLTIAPRLPSSLEWAGIDNLHYRGDLWHIEVDRTGPRIEITRASPGDGDLQLLLANLPPDTSFRIGSSTTFTTNEIGEAEIALTFLQGETVVIQPADAPEPPPPPPPAWTRILFSDNFLTTISPPGDTDNLAANIGAEGGRQGGGLVTEINPAGFGYTVYGQTTFSPGNGWDLRAQDNWPATGPIDTYTLRYRNDAAGAWSTVTPNLGFINNGTPYQIENLDYRIQIQVTHAHADPNHVNDRWAGVSFGQQPDVRFPAFAANGGVIVYPSGDFQVFANGGVAAAGSVPLASNGAYRIDLRILEGMGTLHVNGTLAADAIDLAGITPAWIGLSGFSENNPSIFGSAQFRFDDFTISTLGDPEESTGYDQWVVDQWGEPIPGITGPYDDPDGDGLVNLVEYALARDPLTPDAVNPLETTIQSLPDGDHFVLTYRRRLDAEDVTVFPQFSPDLLEWVPANAVDATLHFDFATGATDPEGVWEEIIATDREPIDHSQRRFYRLQVEPATP